MTIPYTRYIELVTNSALLHSLKSNQLPQLGLALVLLIILLALYIGAMVLLRHEELENARLRGVIEDMHREDQQQLKFPEHENEQLRRLGDKDPGKWVHEAVLAAGAKSWETATRAQKIQALGATNRRCGHGQDS